MPEQIAVVLNRIAADFVLLGALLSRRVESPVISDSAPTENDASASYPLLKDHYSPSEAAAEKLRIEEAYENGLITWDKKRGMKMLVTKRTEGWSPEK